MRQANGAPPAGGRHWDVPISGQGAEDLRNSCAVFRTEAPTTKFFLNHDRDFTPVSLGGLGIGFALYPCSLGVLVE
jgi:hypothetical protein